MTTKKTIYFVRHGESLFNKRFRETNEKPHDLINPGLTDDGKLQCKELGNKLKNIEFDIAIVSPLLRTQETFRYSKLNCKNIITNELCREYKTNECDFLEGEIIKFEEQKDINERCKLFIDVLHSLSEKMIIVISHADFIFYLSSVIPIKNDSTRI